MVRAPRGTTLACRSWLTEAAYRMIQNNLDPEVAENPKALVVYGGIGRAARDWASFDAILAALDEVAAPEALPVAQEPFTFQNPGEGAEAFRWLTLQSARAEDVSLPIDRVVLTKLLEAARP